MGAELVVTWNTWEELLLGGAILRHGTRDWTVVAAELKTRTVSPFSFSPEVCKAKYEELRQQYSGCIKAWFEELKKKRVAELKRDLELSEELIGSLELKLESLKTGMDEKRVDCHVDDGSVGPELHVPLEKLDRVVPSAKEMSKDGLSAGSFTHESQTNWSHECKVPAMSCEDVETKPEVSESNVQEKVLNVDKSTHTIYEGQGGCLKKRRGKRKRKDCGRNTNEASVRESDLSADVCKESSTSNCDEIAKSFGMDEAKANLKKDEIKDLMELLDSFLSVQGASAFCRRHDSQKRGRYKKTIRQHMDFDTIRSRISNGTIKSMLELIRDLLLLTNNAILFYSKITREYKIALKLRDLAIKTSAEKLKFLSSSASTSSPVPDPQVKVRSMSTSHVHDPPVKAKSITTSPVHDPSMKVRSMRPGNRKIVAKVAGGSSSAERVSLRAKKEANKVESPSSIESLPIKKAFGGRTKNVVRESAGQRHATPRKGRKRGKTK
ncbi:hypothetical protein LR48_Vigan01g065000 [Vigna angularis]|uniref:Bromo domain-containing protein n=2 Tax=Phaseolus angularis TaxID=3914 RepID=A0A0L9TKL5_PHAAN|nr:uncharacterized protein LOC108343067 isoform X1 [Vigna angularis]KAG2410115.1 uncharacterized protein HKW66_Vig0007800 [Vigna angularis]KOM31095.1 hypothetical protein LR48_Vigan01g065000 [Vigna angularis]BAT73775.1 hypothetical protein VIGAN_01130900 [Vigna angularis var. angularis]